MITIGVIIPTFQRYRFLRSAIKQIRTQKSKNWIFVLVADGPRGEDYFYYKTLCNTEADIQLGSPRLIGVYDGARPLSMLRWRLGIPVLNIRDKKWWATIRKLLRG